MSEYMKYKGKIYAKVDSDWSDIWHKADDLRHKAQSNYIKYKGFLYKCVDSSSNLKETINSVYKNIQKAEAALHDASIAVSGKLKDEYSSVKSAYNEINKLIKLVSNAKNLITPMQKEIIEVL